MFKPFVFAAALSCLTPMVFAQQAVSEIETSEDTFTFIVGAFYANSDSYMNVTNPRDGGIFPLDFEDDLFLEEKHFLPFFEFAWNFNERHHLYADWKSLHRSADSPFVEKSWIFTNPDNDKEYIVEAGAKISTTLDIDILRIGYGYDLFLGDDYNFGASIGVHTMFVKTIFEGEIGICSPTPILQQGHCQDVTANPRVVDNNTTAPLPNIGLFGSYEFLPGWTIAAHAQYFALKYDDVKGSLVDIRASVDAMINENWSLTFGYNYYEVDVDYKQTASAVSIDFHIADYNLNYSFTGPMFAVMYQF
ncbi:hypothetical protein [Shewanella maritima]|uniref:hypothetical protein n=1 Tax=Shewanella maritima TaxID=2520507 RepID=UPI003736AFD0